MARGKIKLRTQDVFQEERMSLYQLIKRRKRTARTAIQPVQDQESEIQFYAGDIVRIFSDYMRNKYSPIPIDEECIRKMVEVGHRRLSDGWRETVEAPITVEELRAAAYKGESKKSLSRDGIGLEFFKVFRDDMTCDMRRLFTQMFSDRHLSGQQKQGDIVCIPKRVRPGTLEDYRPITLHNTDYKILARLIAARLRPILAELLHPSQHFGVPGKSIFDAVATIRDAIAYAETEQSPLCVVSLDFNGLFDRISHTYLYPSCEAKASARDSYSEFK
jgi:hypothetical protein